MGQNLSLVIVTGWVAEGQDHILRCLGARGKHTSDRGYCQLTLADSRRLGAVQQVPNSGRAVFVVSVDGAGIQHLDGSGLVEEERIGRITVLGEPHLDGLDLTRPKTCGDQLCGSREGTSTHSDLEFLLIEGDRHEEFVGVEIHVVGDRHTAIYHTELLDLELSGVESKRRSDSRDDAVVDPEGRGGLQGASNLNLLGQGVRWERDVEAIIARTAPDGNGDVGILVDSEIIRRAVALTFITTQLEDRLSLALSANLTKVHCQELLAREEILTGSTYTE